jgi:hypothetical protein
VRTPTPARCLADPRLPHGGVQRRPAEFIADLSIARAFLRAE